MVEESIYNISRRLIDAEARIPKEYKKALPVVTTLSKPFWDATTRHEFILQKCVRCGAYQWYPKPWCIECGSRELAWTRASGLGTVYSFTTIAQVVQNSPAFEADLPFVLAEIDLDEGPRFLAQLEGVKPQEAKIGMRVKVTFVDAMAQVSIPKFKKADA